MGRQETVMPPWYKIGKQCCKKDHKEINIVDGVVKAIPHMAVLRQ